MNLSSKKILVVDDDKEMLFLVETILRERGYDVIVAVDGLKAIERSNQDSPDLILMDVMMPFFSGFWFCDAFKHRPRTRNVPVIVISSLSDEANVRKAYKMGAAGFLKKPFEVSELVEMVRKNLA